MKREEVKSKIPGITDEQLDWLMNENGADINTEKNNTTQAQGELAAAKKTIKELQDAAKAFDGADVGDLKKQLSDLQTKYDADMAAMRRDNAIELALAGCRAKNSKAPGRCWIWTLSSWTATSSWGWTNSWRACGRKTPGSSMRTNPPACR